MKYIFFGTPERATTVLRKLVAQDLTPAAIVSAPDQPIGRKQIITPSEVSQYASEHNIDLYQPKNKNELADLQTQLDKYEPDFLVVVAYGYLIPANILDIARCAPVNIHYSLLPRWRGASPVIQQILNHDQVVGWTVMRMTPSLDAGEIYYQHHYPMPDPLPTTAALAQRMSQEAGEKLPQILSQIINNELMASPQDDSQATYCTKVAKTDGLVNLIDNPIQIHQKSQAYTPWPKTFFYITREGQEIRVKINATTFHNHQLQLVSVTPAGKNAMSWPQFVQWLGYDPLPELPQS